ncbi:MAG: L,D-transpeptidase family protein [Spirochaetes bacterium]|nr:L,D-transpeptidase family protein [Spirochaetota bacterium]
MIASCKSQSSDSDQFSKVTDEVKNILLNAGEIINTSSQIIIVTSIEKNPDYAELYSLEKDNGFWINKFQEIKVTIGKNGFTDKGMKKEGDGKTPSGVYKLGTAFGYEKAIKTKMPYRQSTENDFWIDNVNSDEYNTWVSGKTEAKSFERMKRNDHLYKYGIVVEYNTDPIVKGAGSAIFMHVWRAPGSKTAGCVAMSEDDILKILDWLEAENKPVVVLGMNSY